MDAMQQRVTDVLNLLGILGVAADVELCEGALVIGDFDSPGTARVIARYLIATGNYESVGAYDDRDEQGRKVYYVIGDTEK